MILPLSYESRQNSHAMTDVQGTSLALEHLTIEPSLVTPEVDFDGEKGLLLLRGVSMPEDMGRFYAPLLNWIRKYTESPASKTVLRIEFSYFNTATSKVLLELFALLEHAAEEDGHEISIEWCFNPDDFDMIEAGENYQMLLRLPFHLVETQAKPPFSKKQ